jgi:Alkylmercury lyase
MDGVGGAIAYAYPFTGHETEHRVRLHGRQLNAVCAIDALGIAGMLRTDAVIESSCRVAEAGLKSPRLKAGNR